MESSELDSQDIDTDIDWRLAELKFWIKKMNFPSKYSCLKKSEFKVKDYKIIPIRYKDRINIMNWRNEQLYHLRQINKLT